MIRNYTWIYLLLLLLASSCAIKKIVSPDLAKANEQLIILAEKLKNKTEEKLEAGSLDTTDAEMLKEKIAIVKERAEERQKEIIQAQNFDKGVFTRIANNGNMRSIEKRMVASQASLLKDAKEYEIINESLDLASLFRFEKTAFFAPGRYLVPKEIRPEASEVFGPIVDSIISFANRFPENKLKAKIVTLGYSDDTPAPKGSELYEDICMRLKAEQLTAYQINSYVSFLRAQDIAAIISELLDSQESRIENPENISISILKEGKSTELPNPKGSYQTKDENRRVVKVYWNILPE